MMRHNIFGEITFHVGWKADRNIYLFGKKHSVTMKIQAYFEEDGITKEQEQAYLAYKEKEAEKLHVIEKLLRGCADSPELRFEPKTLFFDRDGSCALLCDDREEPDEGIAVCLMPQEKVLSQDEYL